jgi:uncharacterized protein
MTRKLSAPKIATSLSQPIAAPFSAAPLAVRDTSALSRWGMPAGDLPDVNVWLALAVREHPQHAAAQAYWDETQHDMATMPNTAPQKLWFCRVTALGLLRLLCQAKVVGSGALASDGAWRVYQGFRALHVIGLHPEPDCEEALQALVHTLPPLPQRLWTDAYLAAFAQAAGLRLVTFDKDFSRFALPRVKLLAG